MQPASFRDAFEPVARAMLGDVAVTGRSNAADAVRIVNAVWTDPRMDDVWRELHRRTRADPDTFHFPARALSAGQHAAWFPRERQAAGICYLAEQAALVALQGWPTATDAEMQAAGIVAAPEYLLRVERHRTRSVTRGFVVTMSGTACMVFGTPLYGVVATLAGVALSEQVTGLQVRQMVRGLDFEFRSKA